MKAGISFDSIVDEFAEKIFNHACRMLGTREDAEEATQDVFMKIYRCLDDFRGESKISTWIWRITTNVCLTRISSKRPPTVELDDRENGWPSAERDNDPNPEEIFLAQELREHMAKSISRLNPLEAAAITLFYLEGMDYEEIARILDIPMGSVATALHRGRKRLRALYERREKVL